MTALIDGRPPRICLITREYADDTVFGGIGRIMNMQARVLVEAGADVHVITLAASTRTHYVEHGVHVHRLPAPHVTTRPDMYYVSLAEWSKVVADAYAEIDARWPFDAVDTPEHWGEALHLPLREETALLVTLHGLAQLLEPHSLSEAPTVGQRVLYALELAALRRADMIIAPTQVILRDTRAVLATEEPPATLLPHAFDPSRFPQRASRRPADGVRRLLFTGRLEGRKGVDFALRAAAAVAARGYETELIVAGRDWTNYRRRVLEPLSEELGFATVSYLGEVHERRISELLQEADCVIMPSRQENFHMAANEALASGVPVITSDVNGVTHWYDRECGMVALPLEDPARFGELAADVIEDADWLAEAGGRGAARVRSLLAPQRIAAELLGLYTATALRKRSAVAPAETAAALPDGPVRSLGVLADGGELLRRPDLLGAYAAAIGPEDDATLVVLCPGGTAPAALAAAVAAAGLAADAPRVIVRSDQERAALAAAAGAVLAEGVTADDLAALPRVGVASALRLRDLLPTSEPEGALA
jgi:glycosyltransferase involved in cell wall biosynthesis